MRLKIVAIICLLHLASSLTLNAQWARTYGGKDDDVAKSILPSSDGGYIIFGTTESFGLGNGSLEVWILKINSVGDIEWQKTYGDRLGNYAYSIQETLDGGYIFASTSHEIGWTDFSIIKLSSQGNIEWSKSYGDDSTNRSYSLQQTVDGGYIVAGSDWFPETLTNDVIILKILFDGTVEWSKGYGESGDEIPSSIQQTSDGGYIVAGYTNSRYEGISDIWILKLTSDGIIEWQKTYGGSQDEQAYSIIQANDGGFFVIGRTPSFGAGQLDFLFLKLSFEGDIEWSKTYGGSKHETVYCIQQTFNGGYVVAGYTRSWGAGSSDIWILKLTLEGIIEWQKTYGGSRDEEALYIQQSLDGGYIVAGSTNTYGVEERDILILKLFPNGDINLPCGLKNESNAEVLNIDITSSDLDWNTNDIYVISENLEITPLESEAVVYSLCSGQHTLSLTSTAGGTTDPLPGTYFYDHAERTIINANPNDGYNFIGWSGDVISTDYSLYMTMDSDKSIKANFSENIIEDIIEEIKKTPCFIATAAFGSPHHPYVITLQDFRDKYLMPSRAGRKLVNLYYKYSPPIAELITNHKVLRTTVRIWLVPFVAVGYSMVHFGPIKTGIMFIFSIMPLYFFVWFYRRKKRNIS